MKHLIGFLIPLGTLLLQEACVGQEQSMFLHKYREAIQNYIMTGHEKGWRECDILSDGVSYQAGRQMGGGDHLVCPCMRIHLTFQWSWTKLRH